jgi:hypothetical protein
MVQTLGSIEKDRVKTSGAAGGESGQTRGAARARDCGCLDSAFLEKKSRHEDKCWQKCAEWCECPSPKDIAQQTEVELPLPNLLSEV